MILLFVGVVALAPLARDDMTGTRKNPMFRVHSIALAMYSYANDNNGEYPTGKSSTEVFQKLLDGGYVDDPAIFYDASFAAFGKMKATSKKLEPKNVCWDVTAPLNTNSADFIPVVFTTGYRVNYASGGSAVSLFLPTDSRSAGLLVSYGNMSSTWESARPDGTVVNFIPPDFKPDGKKYVQLTPEGSLAP